MLQKRKVTQPTGSCHMFMFTQRYILAKYEPVARLGYPFRFLTCQRSERSWFCFKVCVCVCVFRCFAQTVSPREVRMWNYDGFALNFDPNHPESNGTTPGPQNNQNIRQVEKGWKFWTYCLCQWECHLVCPQRCSTGQRSLACGRRACILCRGCQKNNL